MKFDRRRYILPGVATAVFAFCGMMSGKASASEIVGIRQLNPTSVEILLDGGGRMTVDFYGENIFRLFHDEEGGIVRNPEAIPPADILVRNPRRKVSQLLIGDTRDSVSVATPFTELRFNKVNGMMTVTDLRTGHTVVSQSSPVEFKNGKTTLSFERRPEGAGYYGGGVQNGRFSHDGRKIAIENQNSWTDGGVASPSPFFWSDEGYGVMFHTFSKGVYDFGASNPMEVNLTHNSPYLDMFVMIDNRPEQLLSDYYQLTGKPILIPKFGFYEGHLNAYNRDYWTEDSTGILFEDGKRYKESQKDNGGIKESLNGENGNYQFSARAVIDRYAANDMPLGWILPNDGYGAGYGQSSTLDGNIANLREFGDYARSRGVEIGLWTQSDLHPKEGIPALLQRDIVKEVRDAGVKILKTDVAWVGAGYSFGLNGVTDVGEIMPYYGNDIRPFIISLDGWAGTQRYAGIWSGDQTGGEWEYIRFHIPTYIGSGLSGQPNITSDMDGIFGGLNAAVNTRDFQWKTFSPMQLNMDGWGRNPKYPQALGEPVTSINRNYLKLKSELLPYAYTYAREAVDGKPLIRAMFIDYPNDFTSGNRTRYQYLYGPSFLVAPIYDATAADSLGNDIRHGIYLPEGKWIDYLTGDVYNGECVLNYFDAPLWKLPVFVKSGAIIPMLPPHNNPAEIDGSRRIYAIYPDGKSSFTEYDDDGITNRYLAGETVSTTITSDLDSKGYLTVKIGKSEGNFNGYQPVKSTELIINSTSRPRDCRLLVGGKKIKLTVASTRDEYDSASDAVYYDPSPNINRFSTPGSDAASVALTRNACLLVKIAAVNVADNEIEFSAKGVEYVPGNSLTATHGAMSLPLAQITESAVEAYRLTPSWNPVDNADFYEIRFENQIYTNIRGNEFTFDLLRPETDYMFELRAVNADGATDWVQIAGRTADNPLEFAIEGIRGEVTAEQQSGFGISRLFDFAESGDIFHTRYRKQATPFSITMDLQSVNTLDRFTYLPRADAGNGTILGGNVEVSMDKQMWTQAGEFTWDRTGDPKEFTFKNQPQARYIRLNVDTAVNRYGTGREIYVFKVPGTESYIPGDINSDGKIDINDLTSYMNYTGLRSGDPDFDGYVSVGDVNRNGLIDAYDISTVATRLDEGINTDRTIAPIGGSILWDISRSAEAVGDTLELTIKGRDLVSLNAVSLAIPYDHNVWEYITTEPLAVEGMENLTYDRLHANGRKALYPTFVNIGDKATVDGDQSLFKIRMRRLKRGGAPIQVTDILLVDKLLNVVPRNLVE